MLFIEQTSLKYEDLKMVTVIDLYLATLIALLFHKFNDKYDFDLFLKLDSRK